MKTAGQLLKWYAMQARKAGYPVKGGKNGGGWLNLAFAIGSACTFKREAKRALLARFGRPEFERQMPGPVTVIYSAKKEKRKAFAVTDAFLESYEWRRVRMAVLKRDGARCVCCGATPDDGVRMNVDHIKPRKTHPELALDQNNLQVLCEVCNHGKGNWDQTDWRKKPAANEALDAESAAHIRSIAEGG